jgi:exodeoxyribonuclease III
MTWKFISWNVNGIRAAEKKGFLDWLAGCGADVVAVQETKAHPEQLSPELLNPAGYQASWNWAEKKGYSGTGIYSRQAPLTITRGLNDPGLDTEGRVLIHEYEPFVFFNIYFPNGGRGMEYVARKLAFYKKFLELAQGYQRAGRPVVVTGDFNTAFAEIDLARPKENVNTSGFMPVEREGLGEFFQMGMIDTFRHLHPDTVKYTYWDQVTRARERNVGWRIDYFIVTQDLKDRILRAEIHDEVPGSDHCPLSLELSL